MNGNHPVDPACPRAYAVALAVVGTDRRLVVEVEAADEDEAIAEAAAAVVEARR